MSVIKRGDSKNWYIQFQFKGRTYIKSSKTSDKRVAERMEREWKVKIHSHQILGEKETIRFLDAMELYINTREGYPNHSSLISQSRTLNRIFPVNSYLHEITNQDIEKFVQ